MAGRRRIVDEVGGGPPQRFDQSRGVGRPRAQREVSWLCVEKRDEDNLRVTVGLGDEGTGDRDGLMCRDRLEEFVEGVDRRAVTHRTSTGAWVASPRADDLADYLQRFLHHWNQPDPTEPLRFAVTSAILSNATGFVEQRLLGAVAALDHLSWTDEVLGMGADEMKWRKRGDKRLRRFLLRISVDPSNSSASGKAALAEYGAERNYHDLAASVFEIRNRLIHPRPGENVYASPGVLLEAWRHASYWLELAILHRLAFAGEVHDRTVPDRWVGDTVLVPWGHTGEVAP